MTTNSGDADCIVVGGGLVGLLTARALLQEGLSVFLLEQGEVARESSWAGGGILSPLVPWKQPDAVNALVARSQQDYPALVRELQDETGCDVGWLPSGLLITGPGPDSAATAWAAKYHARIEPLDRVQTQSLEPALAQGIGPSLLLPDVAQIRNPHLCAALAESLQQRGVCLHTHTRVTGLQMQGGRVRGVVTERGVFSAERVIIAGGAWSAPLLETVGVSLPVIPVRGQIVMFAAPPELLHHIVLHAGYYLIPRKDGLVLVGSTLEYTGYDKSTTPNARELLCGKATALVPALADYPVIKHWAGLRPGSPHGIPYIGAHPDLQGLYVNTGHFRNGVVTAPASARLLVDILLARPGFTAVAPYALDRELQGPG